MTETNETTEPSGASGGSDSHVPAWADNLGREIAMLRARTPLDVARCGKKYADLPG